MTPRLWLWWHQRHGIVVVVYDASQAWDVFRRPDSVWSCSCGKRRTRG